VTSRFGDHCEPRKATSPLGRAGQGEREEERLINSLTLPTGKKGIIVSLLTYVIDGGVSVGRGGKKGSGTQTNMNSN